MADVDEKLEEMERKLEDIYRRAQKETSEQWTKYLTRTNTAITDAEKKYKEAKDENEAKKYKHELERLKKQKTFLDGRYKKLTQQTAERISKVNEIATAYINGELPDVFSAGHNSVVAEAGDYVKGYGFDMVDADTVKKLATENNSLLPYKKIDKRKDVRWNVQKINSEVLQGILQGESMPEIAKRFSTVMDMNEVSAIRNARTAVTSAENSGRFDGMKRLSEKGVPMKKQWIAAKDSHTRDAHLEMDGQEKDIDEPFESSLGEIMFPGDPDADPANTYNCRCTMRTIIDLDALDKKDVEETEESTEFESRYKEGATIAEINQQFEQICDTSKFGAVGVDFTGVDIEVANRVAKTLVDLYDEFDVSQFGGIIAPAGNTKLGKMISNATAGYSPVRNSFLLNRKSLKNVKTAEKMLKAETDAITDLLAHPEKYDMSNASSRLIRVVEASKVSGRATVPDTIEEVINHEFGHCLEKQLSKLEDFSLAKDRMSEFAPGISGYANDSVSEYIAESFAAWRKGGIDVDPVLVKCFSSLRRK